MPDFGLTPAELRTLRSLKTPVRIQSLVESFPYHHAGSAWSPRKVLREGTAHCLEGAIFAAAALRLNGFPPLVLDLEAEQDTDHVVAVYKSKGHWGALGKSNFASLRFREPIYRTLRELVLSYFDGYCNLRRERTLRRYSRAIDLSRFDHLQWMTSEKNVWFIPEYLCEVKHYPLITPAMAKRLSRLDERAYKGTRYGAIEKH